MAIERVTVSDETTTVGYLERGMSPVLEIDSGDVVDMETATAYGDRITPTTTLEDMRRWRDEDPDSGPHTLTGPIRVRGATAGHVLRVDILELKVRPHGMTVSYPTGVGTGLLPEDFPEGAIWHFEHDLERMTTALGDIELPIRPFLGFMAVAPELPGRHSTIPPGSHGGNLDLKELVAGSSLYLPVWEDGAQLQIGDAHSRQGNGEVCVTAIETAMEHAVLRLTVVDDLRLERPMAETPDQWITVGFDPDPLVAAKTAVRSMISFLRSRLGISALDAYALCSIAVDLSVTQLVNGHRGIHASVDKTIVDSAR